MFNHTFRLAFLRRKIRNTFQSPVLKAALLAELRDQSPDSQLVVQMVDKVQKVRSVRVQPVQPQPSAQPDPAPAQSQPAPGQPDPVRIDPVDPVDPVVQDGGSEDTAYGILDSENELVEDMTLSPR